MQSQLASLRRMTAKIDRKYAAKTKPTTAPEDMPGYMVETTVGRHWEMEKVYPMHGGMETARLADLPADLLGAISDGAIPYADPRRIAFLDTETTGLAGGTGTVAFVTGVGRIAASGFVVRQFFLRDFDEEASALTALAEHLAEFDVLVTYNGKAFDQPLLETRYRMTRQRPPFGHLEHLDLLYGARRLWKLRFESCRLVHLENQVLGVERVGDVPGHLIPVLYFDYLRTKRASPLEPVFEHNRLDIVSLACLTAIVPRAFHSPHEVELAGTEMIGLGRWLIAAERFDDGLVLLRRAVEQHIPDELLFRALWDIAVTEKKLDRGVAAFRELTESRNPYRVAALEELAKHHEHVEKDAGAALEFTLTALAIEESAGLRKREERLRKKASRPRAGRLMA
jgi:uncharacterized protein YprB with RNaseH-like and TPR domain